MQALGMYGYVDKYDFVIAAAKTLGIMGKSVLVIDATSDEKYRYLIPAIDKSQCYLTQYSEIDFAVGFASYEGGIYMCDKNNKLWVFPSYSGVTALYPGMSWDELYYYPSDNLFPGYSTTTI